MGISVDDPEFQEWKECRSTIARMDTILKDLRKYGFTLITGLLTASAFLGGPGTGRADAGVAAVIAVMVLVIALFSIDTYYSAGLSGAVERALDIEVQTQPHIRITRTISKNRERAGVNGITLLLYVLLLVIAVGLGVVTANGSMDLVRWPLGFGALLVLYVTGYWRYVSQRTGMNSEKKERIWPEDAAELAHREQTGTAPPGQARPTT